jgi:hypothetical protein
MICASRRAVMAGGLTTAIAVPTVAGLADWRWRHGEASVLVYDPALAAGRRFAAAGEAQGGAVQAIEGDRIRFARAVLEKRPALIAGVSRHADALLIEDAAQEAGYSRVTLVSGRAQRCEGAHCNPGWQALGRLADAAGGAWVEALASYAARPGKVMAQAASAAGRGRADTGLVLGWVLAPRG